MDFFSSRPKRATVSPLLAYDLSKAVSVEVDNMLRFFIAQIVLDEMKPIKDRMPEMNEYLEQIRKVVKPIVTESELASPGEASWGSPHYMHAQFEKFQQTKTETEGYEPWINFTNTALRLLKDKAVTGLRERNTEDDIIMQRTDPSYLEYNTKAIRKPDIAFLKLKRAQALHGTKEDWDMIAAVHAPTKPPLRDEQEHIDGGPKDAGLSYFDWSDVLFFFEHRSTTYSPESLSFKDLLVSPVPSQSHKQSIDEVIASSSSAGRLESQKMSTDGTASSSSKSSQQSSLSHSIAEDVVSVSLPVPTVDHEKHIIVQGGEYGLGRLNSWFGMTHSLGCLVLGSQLYICWFDRQGLIGSSAIDVSKDLEGYLVLLFILQRFKDDEWGRLGALDDSTIHIQDKAWKVDAEDIPHKPRRIIGRNTTVIGCSEQPPASSQPAPSISASTVSPIYGMPSVNHQSKQGDGIPVHDNELLIYDQTRPASYVAAEDSIPGPSNADESQMKEQTKKDEEGHAGEAKKIKYVVKFGWPQETRIPEHVVYKKIEDVAQTDDDVKGHVPDLVAYHTFDGTSTAVIRDALGISTSRSRLLVAIIFERLDGTIRDLSGAGYWKVYWETFLCHYGLWKQGVYHRDISNGNLMYKKDKNTGEVIGVLADFDLSSLQDTSNTERTGTLPFMALDLLSEDALDGNVVHDYGHEAEAYFWVGVYDTACYDNGKSVDSTVPAQWNSLGADAMEKEKRSYLAKLGQHKPAPSQRDVWQGLSLLSKALKKQHIFDRPNPIPDSEGISLLEMSDPSSQSLDAWVLEADKLRDAFLEMKGKAEIWFPSLLNRTSTSS